MGMPLITKAEILEKLPAHREWLESFEPGRKRSGTRLEILDKLIADVHFDNDDFTDAFFVRCRLERVHFSNCRLVGCLFYESIFVDCSFVNCDLGGAEFNDTDCTNVNFTGSDLFRASLIGAKLIGANLTNCVMTAASLMETDLRYAILDNAQLNFAGFLETKVFNVKKDRIGSLDNAYMRSIYTSPEGDGGELFEEEALRFLQSSV